MASQELNAVLGAPLALLHPDLLNTRNRDDVEDSDEKVEDRTANNDATDEATALCMETPLLSKTFSMMAVDRSMIKIMLLRFHPVALFAQDSGDDDDTVQFNNNAYYYCTKIELLKSMESQ